MESDETRGQFDYDSGNLGLNPDFLSRYVSASRASINRNVIAKCLEFCEVPLLKYFYENSSIQDHNPQSPNFIPYTSDQISQVDTLSWCTHQIEMQGIGIQQQGRSRPFYEYVNNLASIYRRHPRELPLIDFDQIVLPLELDELFCTIGICCKYYIADCLKRAQEDAITQGSTMVTARHIYEAARRVRGGGSQL